MSYQNITISGNVGNEPELRKVGEQDVCNFSVAVTRRFNDRQGNPQEDTRWFRIAAWGAQATPCATYLVKGSRVIVEGEVLEPSIYQDAEGYARASLEVRARLVDFADRAPGEGGTSLGQRKVKFNPAPGTRRAPAQQRVETASGVADQDIPF